MKVKETGTVFRVKMKVVVPQRSSKFFYAPPPIKFERVEPKKAPKSDLVTFPLRAEPANPDSQTFEVTIAKFRFGNPENWINTNKVIRRIVTGTHATTAPQKFRIYRQVLDGDAAAVFNNRATELGAETNPNLAACVAALTRHVFPRRSLTFQKRYMRRYMRKPRDVNAREYVARVTELNNMLAEFPHRHDDDALAGEEQCLPEDEILDILEYGVPNTWQKGFVHQGFNPLEHTLNEFVEMCERFEYTEAHETSPGTKSNTESKTGKDAQMQSSKKGENRNKNGKRGHTERDYEFYCEFHGPNSSHNTGQCKVIKAQAKKMRLQRESLKGGYDKKKSSPGKYSGNEEELHTLVTGMVEKALKSKAVKRKKEQKEKDSFNVEEFDNLSLSDDSDDE